MRPYQLQFPPRARARHRPMSERGRYLGSWRLPSGNTCDVYLAKDIEPGTLEVRRAPLRVGPPAVFVLAAGRC